MPTLLFREDQYVAGWPFLLLVGIGIVLPLIFLALAYFVRWPPSKRASRLILVLVAALLFLVSGVITLFYGVMTTEVFPGEVHVRFGWLTSHSETISLAKVHHMQVVTYDPMSEFRGWGIRSGPGGRALTQKGDRGVRLFFRDHKPLLIGSQEPQDLFKALGEARRRN
jgi:hypothetical protein